MWVLAVPVSEPIWQHRFTAAQPAYRFRIKAFARKNFRALPGLEQQDLEAELVEVLWLACMKYDPNNGACFNTFFWQSAKNRFLDLHKAASRKMRVGDYDRVSLTQESVQRAVYEMLEDASAEDEVMARITVRERFRSGGKSR